MGKLRRLLHKPIEPLIAGLCLAVLCLNLVDAFATLRHIEHGAVELNPFMSALLRRGAHHFLVTKYVLASAGLIGIAMYPGRRAALTALGILFPLYSLLGIYQIAL